MNDYQALLDAYRILAQLYSQAWAEPAEVPTQIALMLLHAREHVGDQVKEYFGVPVGSTHSDVSLPFGKPLPETNATIAA